MRPWSTRGGWPWCGGENAIARDEFAEDFTHERDGLHAALMARARERNLGRRWADTFFRVSSRRRSSDEDLGEDEVEVEVETVAEAEA